MLSSCLSNLCLRIWAGALGSGRGGRGRGRGRGGRERARGGPAVQNEGEEEPSGAEGEEESSESEDVVSSTPVEAVDDGGLGSCCTGASFHWCLVWFPYRT
jgi:hypothetical protein